MSDWKTLDEPPRIGQRVFIAAWEFGCEPIYLVARFWQSSLPGQPPKFYLDETYRAERQAEVGSVVHYWMPIPQNMERSKMLRFPWPDPRLSPNSRERHRYLADVRDLAHQAGLAITCDAGLVLPKEGDLEWRLIFCPPDRRRRDLDNLYSAFKSTCDGIFAALQTDDSRIRKAVLEYGSLEPPNGAVYIEINKLENE